MAEGMRPRTRGPTPRKFATAGRLARSTAQVEAAQLRWLAALGPNDGFLTWSSSPHVMWLGSALAGAQG
jgi:hypothetical protein